MSERRTNERRDETYNLIRRKERNNEDDKSCVIKKKKKRKNKKKKVNFEYLNRTMKYSLRESCREKKKYFAFVYVQRPTPMFPNVKLFNPKRDPFQQYTTKQGNIVDEFSLSTWKGG